MSRTQPSRRRRGEVATLAGAMVAAALPLSALSVLPASAAVSGGESIEVFTGTNLVSLTGYPGGADVRVEVLRQGFVIGSATKAADANGAIEMNHVGGTDCFEGPTSPDIMPGDTLRTTVVGTENVDTSVVRGVFVDSLDINDVNNTIVVTGHVTLEGPSAVVPVTDVLELRINKGSDNTWEFNDRPGRTDRRVDIGPDVQPDGTWVRTLRTSQDDIDDLQVNGFEHFLEWSAGAAAGEEEAEEVLPSELTVWDPAGGEAIDCPPLQQGPTAPQLDASMDSGTAGDHITSQSAGLSFGGLTGEAGPGAAVTLFVDGEKVATGTADAEGVYSFAAISLPERARPYALHVRAQGEDAPFFESGTRMVTVDATNPGVRLRRFAPRRLQLAGRERVHAVYRVREASQLQVRVQQRGRNRWRTVKTFRDRTIGRARRVEYNWNGRDETRRNVRPGRFRLVLDATDPAGNATTHRRRFRVVRASAPSRPRIRRASSGARGGRNTAVARWSRPLTNNGERITGYRVRALRLRPNGSVASRRTSRVLRPRARSHEMRLRAGRYRFRVRAINSVGSSRWSPRSNRVRSR